MKDVGVFKAASNLEYDEVIVRHVRQDTKRPWWVLPSQEGYCRFFAAFKTEKIAKQVAKSLCHSDTKIDWIGPKIMVGFYHQEYGL